MVNWGRLGDIIKNAPAAFGVEALKWGGFHETANNWQEELDRADSESQARHSSPPSPEEKAKLDEAPKKPELELFSTTAIAYGESGEDVKKLQTFLGMKPTGVFDKATENNVKAFQSKHGLEADGFVGFDTLQKVEQEINKQKDLSASLGGNSLSLKGVAVDDSNLIASNNAPSEVPNLKENSNKISV
jgi:hypothetical protein